MIALRRGGNASIDHKHVSPRSGPRLSPVLGPRLAGPVLGPQPAIDHKHLF